MVRSSRVRNFLGGHVTFIQRRINVEQRHNATLYKWQVPTGLDYYGNVISSQSDCDNTKLSLTYVRINSWMYFSALVSSLQNPLSRTFR